MKCTTLVQVSDLKSAIESYIEGNTKAQEQRLEKQIKFMLEYKPSLWERIFGSPYSKDREEAIIKIQNSFYYFDYFFNYKSQMKGLLNLCEVSSVGLVEIDGETASKLKKYFPSTEYLGGLE